MKFKGLGSLPRHKYSYTIKINGELLREPCIVGCEPNGKPIYGKGMMFQTHLGREAYARFHREACNLAVVVTLYRNGQLILSSF